MSSLQAMFLQQRVKARIDRQLTQMSQNSITAEQQQPLASAFTAANNENVNSLNTVINSARHLQPPPKKPKKKVQSAERLALKVSTARV